MNLKGRGKRWAEKGKSISVSSLGGRSKLMQVCQQERLVKLQACALQRGGPSDGGCAGCLFSFSGCC